MSNYIIFGASRGLGAAFAVGLPKTGDKVWVISRRKPYYLDKADGVDRNWIKADLATPMDAIPYIKEKIGHSPIDALIYNAGIWETDDFDKVSDLEIQSIVDVNLTALLLSAKHLTPNLRASNNPKVILIGSTSGLENEGTVSAAYAATKFACRGAAHSLREMFRQDGIGVSCISPGSMATDIGYEEGIEKALSVYNAKRIPVEDIVKVVSCILSMSRATCIKEIFIPAIPDTDV